MVKCWIIVDRTAKEITSSIFQKYNYENFFYAGNSVSCMGMQKSGIVCGLLTYNLKDILCMDFHRHLS